MALRIHKVDREDIFQDLVRVHISHRKGIRAGRLCRVTINGKSIVAVARNSLRNDTKGIWLDNSQRAKLGVKAGDDADFSITPTSWYEELLWIWRASDPVNRTAGRLGILSLLLGITGVVLGAWSVWLAFRPPGH